MPKTAKITVFDPVIRKTPDVPLQDELLCWTCVVYGYFYFMQLLCHSVICTTLNCALHSSNYVRSTFKAAQEKRPLLSGHRWDVANFELAFPSRKVLIVDWFSESRLVNIGWLVIFASYQHILQMYIVQYSSILQESIRSSANHQVKHNDFCCFRGKTNVTLTVF